MLLEFNLGYSEKGYLDMCHRCHGIDAVNYPIPIAEQLYGRINDMTEKKVSVIIPIYNAAQYLHKCLKSVISQTYKNLDIILIDDGSSDDSYSIAKEYQEKDSRIRLFTQTNIGLISTRKRGIELAEGRLLVLLIVMIG